MLFVSSIVQEIEKSPVMCHSASLVETPKGRLICAWYEGAYETSPDTVIKYSYWESKSSGWEGPKTLIDFRGAPLGNPVLFSFDESRLFLIFSLVLGESWEESILCISNSNDGGETWSNPAILFARKGFMGKTQPIMLSSGRIVIPIYNEAEICPYVMILDKMDSFQNAKVVAETMARGIAIQPVVVELEPNKLLMLCRTNRGTIWKSLSYNGGLSWSILIPTRIPNPNSAIDLVRTSTGQLLLAFNNSKSNRNSLSVALSDDKGRSWSFMRIIERGEGEYSYPCLVTDNRGTLHLVYTESRYRIKHVRFDLDWIRQEALPTPLWMDEEEKSY